MPADKLKVVWVEERPGISTVLPLKKSRRHEIQEEMETLWRLDPAQFDTERDAVQRRRICFTFQIVQEMLNFKNAHVVDLGVGDGALTRRCRDAGARVDAVDIASKALEELRKTPLDRISLIQDCMPNTSLKDNAYDLVLCAELIGFLKPVEYRMAIAELSRLVTKEGHVICSTSLDLNSDDALEKFVTLFETEFIIERSEPSYDRLLLRVCHILETPQRIVKKCHTFAFQEESTHAKMSWVNSALYNRPLLFFWQAIDFLAYPLAKKCRQSDCLRRALAKISQFLWQEASISHMLLVGKRRALGFPLPKSEMPREMKHKRAIWE